MLKCLMVNMNSLSLYLRFLMMGRKIKSISIYD